MLPKLDNSMIKYMHRETVMQTIAVIGFFIVISCLGTQAISLRLTYASEVADCMRLKAYSEKFALFWLTQEQKDMCLAHEVTIDAPVGNPYEKN